MEHSIQGIPPITNEAHSFPASPGFFGKGKQVYALALLVIRITCFKSEAVEAQSPWVVAPMLNEVKERYPADGSIRV